MNISLEKTELGKHSTYDTVYNPHRLCRISRAGKREALGIALNALPFYGVDSWTHYEVSWLDKQGKPRVAIADICYDCRSPYLIESKSLKLYFNSLNNEKFNNIAEIEALVTWDLQTYLESAVTVCITALADRRQHTLSPGFSGICLDDLPATCSVYQVEPAYLAVEAEDVEETLYSDLLKSNCLVTGQPDWGSIQIFYKGKRISHEGLLKYLVSYREHHEFHEQCIERIFMDIFTRCKPTSLTVYGRYTRRGGLDINPYRSTEAITFSALPQRLIRQ